MEQSAAAEDNHQNSERRSVSRSSPLLRIDTITIDLASAMDNHQDASPCDHFSIREYVAAMREKDIGICLPLFDYQNDAEEQKTTLPSLDVIKSRWWSCHNCLREIGVACSAEESEKISNSSRGASESKGTSSILGHSNVATRGASASACAEVNRDENFLPSSRYEKEKRGEVWHFAGVGSGNDATPLMSPVTKSIISLKPSLNPETHASSSGCKSVGNVDVTGPGLRGNLPSYFGHLGRDGKENLEFPQIGASNSANGMHRMDMGDYEIIPHVDSRSTGYSKDAVENTIATPSRDDSSSESGDGCARNDNNDKAEDSSGNLVRERAPKVRLLTELLGSGGNAENDQNRTDACSDSPSDNSNRSSAPTIPKPHSKGKRKISHGESGDSILLPKKFNLLKGDAEIGKVNCVTVDTETEDSGDKWVQQKAIRTHKKKRTQYEGGFPVLMPRPDVPNKYQFTATDSGFSKPFQYMQTSNEVGTYYRSSMSPKQADRKNNSSKKKNIQAGGVCKTASVPHWNTMVGEGLTIRKDSGASERKGTDLSLTSYGLAHRELPPWRKATREGPDQGKDILRIGEPNVVPKSTPNLIFGKKIFHDLNENNQSPVRDKQNAIPRFGERSVYHHHKLDNSGIHINESKNGEHDKGNEDIPMEIVELMAKNQYDRRRHETEINFFSTERAKEKMNTGTMGEFSRVSGNGVLKFYQEDNHRVRKPLVGTSTAKSSEHLQPPFRENPFISFAEMNEKHRSNLGKLDGKSAFTRCTSSFVGQDVELGRVRFPESSNSIRNSNFQNFQWKGELNRSSFSPKVAPNYMNIPQNYAPLSSNFVTSSHVPETPSSKGKMVGDLDLNFVNAKNNNSEKQNRDSSFDMFGRSSSLGPFASKHRGIDLNATVPGGSLDLHSNETIPAMQLLSLMDAGMKSKSLLNSDGNHKMLQKPFISSDNHPKALNNPMFLSDHRPKESLGRSTGVSSSGSRPPLSSIRAKNHWSENAREFSPPIQAFAPFASSFRNEGNLRGENVIPARISSRTDQKMKGPMQNSSSNLLKPLFGTGNSRNNHNPNLILNDERESLNGNETVSPLASASEKEDCLTNMNPADFSTPEPGSMFMIDGKDLKVGKRTYSNGKQAMTNVDGRKRQKGTKANGKQAQ